MSADDDKTESTTDADARLDAVDSGEASTEAGGVETGALPTGRFNAGELAEGARRHRDDEQDIDPGSMPTGRFDASRLEAGPQSAAPADSSTTIERGGWKLTIPMVLPTWTWLDDATTARRITYGAGGLIAGVVVGIFFGLLNAVLQGWNISSGIGQLLSLAAICGTVCAAMAAARPARCNELLARLDIGDD